MSRHVITEEDRKPEILLEQEEIKRLDAKESGTRESETAVDEKKDTTLKIGIKVKRKEPQSLVDGAVLESEKPDKKLKMKSLVDYGDSDEE